MNESEKNKLLITIPQNAVGENSLAEKLDKFTYGLLYPAFFGNMIYDLITWFRHDSSNNSWTFAIAIAIVFFNIIDFMHLYVDVENSIDRKLKNKNPAYIICDILASVGLFVAFVLVKNFHNPAGLWVYFSVPFFIAIYKTSYHWQLGEKKMIQIFAAICLLLALAGQLIYCFYSLDKFYLYTTIVSYVILISYGIYVFYFYGYFRNKSLKPPLV